MHKFALFIMKSLQPEAGSKRKRCPDVNQRREVLEREGERAREREHLR